MPNICWRALRFIHVDALQTPEFKVALLNSLVRGRHLCWNCISSVITAGLDHLDHLHRRRRWIHRDSSSGSVRKGQSYSPEEVRWVFLFRNLLTVCWETITEQSPCSTRCRSTLCPPGCWHRAYAKYDITKSILTGCGLISAIAFMILFIVSVCGVEHRRKGRMD